MFKLPVHPIIRALTNLTGLGIATMPYIVKVLGTLVHKPASYT
jgi:hypothetical protein